MSTADMLADLGYAVVEAASAEEALAALGSGRNGGGADRSGPDGNMGDPPRLMKPFRQAELASRVAAIFDDADPCDADPCDAGLSDASLGRAAARSAAAAEAAPVYAVLYVSRCRPLLHPTELDRLVGLSRVHNRAAGITGALLFTRDNFAQVLEGGRPEVDALMASIRRDPRHHSVTILRAGDIAERGFGRWGMAYSGESSYAARQVVDAAAAPDEIAGGRAADRLLWMMREFARQRG